MRGEALAAGLLLAATTLSPAQADTACWDVAWRCRDINSVRAAYGRPPLDQVGELQRGADTWAEQMAADGVLRHDPTAGAGFSECVGYGPDWLTVMAAFDGSDHHRDILLDRGARHVGIGTARAGGVVFVVVRTTG